MSGAAETGRVTAWRITHVDFAEDPFSGAGAAEAGGRFNSPGRAVVYAAGSLALAMLEILVHLDEAAAPDEFVAFQMIVPGRLVENFDERPHPGREGGLAGARARGDAWLESVRSAVLRIPSAVLPFEVDETNFLIDPGHPDFAEIVLGPPRKFRFDARLFQYQK